MQTIKNLWEGNVPLVRTFWVWGFAFKVALNAILLIVGAWSVDNPVYANAFLGVWLFSVVYFVFISVAIWRSSNRYEGNKVWAVLAKCAVVLGVLQTLASFAG